MWRHAVNMASQQLFCSTGNGAHTSHAGEAAAPWHCCVLSTINSCHTPGQLQDCHTPEQLRDCLGCDWQQPTRRVTPWHAHAPCRQGIARALLAAADAAVAADGHSQVWLHVRLADEAATALYQAGGYREVARDAGGVGGALRGLLGGGSGAGRPRILMRKDLGNS